MCVCWCRRRPRQAGFPPVAVAAAAAAERANELEPRPAGSFALVSGGTRSLGCLFPSLLLLLLRRRRQHSKVMPPPLRGIKFHLATRLPTPPPLLLRANEAFPRFRVFVFVRSFFSSSSLRVASIVVVVVAAVAVVVVAALVVAPKGIAKSLHHII